MPGAGVLLGYCRQQDVIQKVQVLTAAVTQYIWKPDARRVCSCISTSESRRTTTTRENTALATHTVYRNMN
jgi:hypothetical protein